MKVAPGQEAEAVYRHDAKGDCWAESFKNGQINISNGSYAVLPDGAEVVAPHEGAGFLTADSDGNITVSGQVYLKSGVFHLSNNTLTGWNGVVLYDASGKYWATLQRDKKHPNSAVYDAGTRTFSSVQGRIWLTVAEGDEESEKIRIYKFNEENKTVEIYALTGWSEENAELLAVCSCSDWSRATLQVPEDVSSVEDISCIINGTAIQLTEGTVTLPKGKTIAIGTTEYTAAEDGTGLAYNGGKAKLTAGTATFAKGKTITIGTTEYTAAADGTGLANEGGKAKLTAGAATFAKGKTITIGTTEYTAAADGATIDYNGGKGKLTAGTVALEANESIAMNQGTSAAIGNTTYTAAANGTSLVNEGGKAKLTAGAVALDANESIAMNQGTSAAIGNTTYKAAANGTSLSYAAKDRGKLTAGTVTFGKGKTLTVGKTTYTAAANNTSLAYNGGKAKLTAGTVTLDKGESVVVASLGTVTAKTGSLNVTSAGVLTGTNVDATAVKNTGVLTIKGTSSANLLKAGSGNTKLYGYDGKDTLAGGAGNDTLDGGAGNDSLWGGAGNDTLMGGLGNDVLWGGAGSDIFYYTSGDGKDTIRDYGTGSDVIALGKGTSIQSRKASGNDVILTIGTGTLTLKNAAEKKITVKDAKGKKTTYSALVTPLPKNASYTDSKKTAVKLAAAFKGTFDAGKYASTIKTVDAATSKNKNALTIKGNKNANLLKAGSGNTKLYGYDGKDTLAGGAGNDLLDGGAGNDSLAGGNGKDTLTGGAGNDLLNGGAGNDSLVGGNGKDSLAGGNGNDLLNGGAENDSLVGGNGKDTLTGGAGNDTLNGGDGNDSLVGGAGNDSLSGGKGNDSLWGGAGNDTLTGGLGNDTLTGGAGKDVFLYSKGDGKDVICSYTDAQAIKVLSGQIDSVYATGKHKKGKGYVEDVVLCIGSGSVRLDDVSLTSTVHVIDASGKKKNYAVSSLKTK